jgi:hypothetical protein
MEVSDQLHALAALSRREEFKVFIGYEVVCLKLRSCRHFSQTGLVVLNETDNKPSLQVRETTTKGTEDSACRRSGKRERESERELG